MSDFTLKTARAIGMPTESTWAQAHTLADLFFIVVLEKNQSSGESDVNLAASGRQFFLHFEQAYQEKLTAKHGKKNLDTFRVLIQKAVDGVTDSTIVSFAAGMVASAGLLYIVAKNGQVRLKRGGVTKKILETEEITFASGFLEDSDVVVFLSSDLAKEVALHDEVFDSDEPDEIAEALSALLPKAEAQGGEVAFIAKAKRVRFGPLVTKREEKGEAVPKLLAIVMNRMGSLANGKMQRVALTVFLLLAVLFASSLVLGVKKRHQEQAQARFDKVYTEASQKYDEGIALSDLNAQLSQKTFREGSAIIEKEKSFFKEKSEEKEKLSALAKKIDEGLRVALRITMLSDAPVFFDLTLVKEGAVGTSMSLYEGNALVLDTQNGAAYTLTIASKKSDLVVGVLSGAQKEAIGEGVAYLLDDEGIEKVTLATKERSLAIKKDDAWGKIGSIVSFAGNLYLLDRANGSIYKYQGADSALPAGRQGFGAKRSYLAASDAVKPDFSNSVSMAIDGALWVLFRDGTISKFVQGAPQNFSIAGIDIPLSDPRALFTDDESEHLYILDSGNKRVVVVKKDGSYDSQYQWDGIKDVSDIVVSEKEGKILLLSGSKIYGIDIKN